MPQNIFCGQTDIGLKRENNEDVFLLDSDLGYCLTADGLGGAAAGELASKIFALPERSTVLRSKNLPGRKSKDSRTCNRKFKP